MREKQLREVFDRTRGHCHFCGDPLAFEKRGWAAALDMRWEVDHVIQRGKGGAASSTNCLPACTRCNRLRWHRTGSAVRELLELGLLARDEIAKRTPLGVELMRLQAQRATSNLARRKSAGIPGRAAVPASK